MIHNTFKYIILELLEKVYRLKCFISNHKIAQTSNSNENVVLLFHHSLTEILKHLDSVISEVNDSTRIETFTIQRKLASSYEAIINLHSQLKYLHSEWLRPETYTFVKHIINQLPKERQPVDVN